MEVMKVRGLKGMGVRRLGCGSILAYITSIAHITFITFAAAR
jgi:hypothetical protein